LATTQRTSRGEADAPVLCIVDDDDLTVQLVCEVAEESGWTAHGLKDIAELRGFLRRQRPTLLLLDDDLPDGRGGDVARALGDDPDLRDLPVVVCTAAHPERQEEIGRWAPVISKPFEILELERHLRARGKTAAG
jgi:DNA-binding response OmpR family regulator